MGDLLFELGVEEVPAHSVADILVQLRNQFHAKLSQYLVPYRDIDKAATHRRFMIYITGIPDRTQPRPETILGPAKRSALDERGHPTLALKKFVQFNKVKMNEVVEIQTPKGLYMGIERINEGEKSDQIMRSIIPEILAAITFPKTMIWNDSRVPFIRPIRHLLVLFNNRPLEIEFAGVKSSNRSTGHLLLSDGYFEVKSFKDYIQYLNKNFVVLKENERRQKILADVHDIEEDLDGRVAIDEPLLEYYIYSNEYPVVFNGRFNVKYLTLPPEVISTFMIQEKKLMPVFAADGKMLNAFVGVSSIPDENNKVRQGNERVIQATFEDAQFFWDMDGKEDFFSLRQNLKNVMFQKDLGSYYEKSERLLSLIELLVRETGNDALLDPLLKAASHCKNDLLTRMVREFPSLQGIIGGLYLKERNEPEAVWKAIYGHYQPKGFVGEKLDDLGSGLLSICDRIDSIAGLISRGIKITGSKDPYGIRRDANAIIKIVIDFRLNFNLQTLIDVAAANFSKKDAELKKIRLTLGDLFHVRIENNFREILKFRYDVVQAVMSGSGSDGSLNVYEIFLRAEAVANMVESPHIDALMALHRRLKNIIKDAGSHPFSESLLQDKEEKILFDVFRESKERIGDHIRQHEYLLASSDFLEMKQVIDQFFDKVLVMVKDDDLRCNRLALLQRIDELLSQIANFSIIVEINSGGKS